MTSFSSAGAARTPSAPQLGKMPATSEAIPGGRTAMTSQGIAHVAPGSAAGKVDAAQLLDVNGVAGVLACSPRHVYRLADAGRMPAPVRLGALVRWSASELREWIDRGCPMCRRTAGGGK